MELNMPREHESAEDFKSNVDTAYQPILSIMIAVSAVYINDINDLKAKYPRWEESRDARLLVFERMLNLMFAAGTGMIFTKGTLREDYFWRESGLQVLSATEPEQVLEPGAYIGIIEGALEQFMKIGFIQLQFSVVESLLRRILRALDPNACGRGMAEFKSVYDCLMSRYITTCPPDSVVLLDLWREIRNVTHNNGVYFNRQSQARREIVYKSRIYTFRHEKHVDFTDWKTLVELSMELRALLVAVVNDPVVIAISYVEPE